MTLSDKQLSKEEIEELANALIKKLVSERVEKGFHIPDEQHYLDHRSLRDTNLKVSLLKEEISELKEYLKDLKEIKEVSHYFSDFKDYMEFWKNTKNIIIKIILILAMVGFFVTIKDFDTAEKIKGLIN